jgi:hypothetical protein
MKKMFDELYSQVCPISAFFLTFATAILIINFNIYSSLKKSLS